MTGLDASFLYLETPSVHMHVCAAVVCDPSTAPGGYSFDAIRTLIERRLPRLPQFRRRLASVPFGLHHPVWVDDPDFDLDAHVHRIGCPAPGTLADVAALTADIAGRPLDRSRPLWEMWVAEGLADGAFALIWKMHHATVDGVSGANLMMHLFDLEPAPTEPDPQPFTPERRPGDVDLVRYAVGSWLRHPQTLARVLPATVRGATGFVRTRMGRSSGGGMPTPFTAPRVSFNEAITPHRSVAFVDVGLDELKALRRAARALPDPGGPAPQSASLRSATMNDVVLAICSGALRRYLADRGEHPDRSLQAVVPISVHAAAAPGDPHHGAAGANKVSALFTTLATDIEDPVQRLRAIAQTTTNAKEEHHAVGARMLMEWAEFAAPVTFSLAARLYSGSGFASRHRVVYNLVISNVPGPPMPLYFAGSLIRNLYPLGPILEGIGLNVTVLSHQDQVGFGFIGCRELSPDLDDLAAQVPVALAELAAALGVPAGPAAG